MVFRFRNFLFIIWVLCFFLGAGDSFAQHSPYLYFPAARKPAQKRLLSIHNQWFQMGGDLKIGFMVAGDDDTHAFNNGQVGVLHETQSNPRFFLEEILITAQFSLANRMKGHFQLSVKPEAFHVRQGYAVVYLPFSSFIEFGLDRRFFTEDSRDTIIPSLITSTFGGDEDLQFVVGGDYKLFSEQNHIYWKTSISNGRRFAIRDDTAFAGKQQTYPIFHDTRQIEQYDSHKEVGLGIGFGRDFSPNKWIEVLGFSFFSKLNKRHFDQGSELEFLRQVIPGYHSTKRSRYRLGIDTKIQWGRFGLWAQYINGLDGQLTRHAGAITPMYSLPFPKNIPLPITGIDFLYRFNVLDVQAKNVKDNLPGSPFTWDRITHTFAVKVHSKFFFSWQNEFHLNQEFTGDPGNTQVKNNEFISQITFFF